MLAELNAGLEGKATRGRPGRVERWLFVGIVVVAIALSRLAAGEDAQSGSVLPELVWGIGYALAIIGIVVERDSTLPLIRRSVPLLLIVALALISTLWSLDPLLTLRRALGLFGTTAIAYYLVSRYTLAAFLDAVVLVFNSLAVVSAFLIIFMPTVGVMQIRYQGAWMGILGDKNILGSVMGLGIATLLLMQQVASGRRRIELWLSLIAYSILLIGSRSATPLFGVLAVVFCLSIMFRLRDRNFGFSTLLVCSAMGALAFCANAIGFDAGDVFLLFGRDSSLTGRDDIWQTAIQYISAQPVLGYGYQVFWEPSGPVYRYYSRDWIPVTAHDGFLQVALDSGLAGLSLLLVLLFETARRAIRFFRQSGDRLSAWPLLVLVSLTVTNIADASFTFYNDFRWILFMVAFLYATQSYRSKEVDALGETTLNLNLRTALNYE